MISLTILAPDKTLFEGEVSSIIAPGTLGYFQTLVNHASMISTLQPGTITVTLLDGKQQEYSTSGGLFEINSNKAIILMVE